MQRVNPAKALSTKRSLQEGSKKVVCVDNLAAVCVSVALNGFFLWLSLRVAPTIQGEE